MTIHRARLLTLLGLAPAAAIAQEADRDADRVPDARDACPADPETVNAYRDEDGCPDPTFSCAGSVLGTLGYVASHGANVPIAPVFQCEGDTRRWHVVPANGARLPGVLFGGVAGTVTLAPQVSYIDGPDGNAVVGWREDVPSMADFVSFEAKGTASVGPRIGPFTCTGTVVTVPIAIAGTWPAFVCDGQGEPAWLLNTRVGPAGTRPPDEVVAPGTGLRGTVTLEPTASDFRGSWATFVSLETADGRKLVPVPDSTPKKTPPSGTATDEECFLTTAVALRRGQPDDCEELVVMRRFRDRVLGRAHPDVVLYQRIAPAIVARVEAREDAGAVWAVLYADYLVPILELVRSGRHAEAHAAYRLMVTDLARGVRLIDA